ncbi:MAG: HlyD family type I secretion periplasmic adaptor subunit [Scytolyngbya sp. HA4215-MV1]|jgi:HlyD family secretion protein|nr:HlyD family type I secretion periplasmic adaptor subunit [Scytolyngbya sp. HA4215-MV1]
MRVSISSSPAQSRQIRQQLANPEHSLSYELGKAVQELPPLYTRILASGISLMVFGTIAWAHFSKIDEVATAPGELIPSVQVRPVRALGAGTIKEIKVREGEQITKGEVLIELDSGLPQTAIDRLANSARLIRQDLARLEAERAGSVTAGSTLQDELLEARLRAFNEQQAAANAEANQQFATISEAEARLSRLQENLINARENLKNAQDQEAGLRTLLADKAIPRLEYIRAKDNVTNAEDKIVSIEKEMDAQQDRIQQAKQSYQAASSKSGGLSSQRQSEVLTQLTKRREELATVEGQLAQAKKERERETVEAPVNGTVYSMKATRGPVQGGEELLSVLPEGEDLLLEVKVLNRDIGFVREKMRAKVKLATFPYQEFGIVEGEVVQVSPNAIVDKDLGLVFPTRIKLSKAAIEVRGKSVDLTPGMAATAEIVTRKKSILTFLMEPITRRFSEAFSVR